MTLLMTSERLEIMIHGILEYALIYSELFKYRVEPESERFTK